MLPKAGNPTNAALLADLKTQLLNVIRARNDIDRVVSNNSTVIPIGTTSSGIPLSFDANSVAMMDRVLAQYILATTSNGTVLPQAKARKSRRKSKYALTVTPLASGSSAFWTALTQVINTTTGAVSYLSDQQLQKHKHTTFDDLLSTISIDSSVIPPGQRRLGLLRRRGAAPLAAALGTAAAAATIIGFLFATASIGNDLVNVYTNVAGLVNHDPNVNAADLGKSLASLATDGIVAYANAEGMGGLQAGASAALGSVLDDIFNASAKSTTWGTAALLGSTDNLLWQKALSTDSNDAASSIGSVTPSDFGIVDGPCTIGNSQGPILAGLSGVGVGNANGSAPDTLTSVAAPLAAALKTFR